MNRNYLIIGLIILALVVIGVIAARQPEVPLGTDETGETETETTNAQSLLVSDQAVTNESVIVDNVYSNGAGWVVLYRTTEEGDLDPTSVAGMAQVNAGNNQDVVVSLTGELENGELLVAVLHADDGTVGEFEFSEETPNLDMPAQENNEMVISFFTVSTETADADDAEAEEEVTEETETESAE